MNQYCASQHRNTLCVESLWSSPRQGRVIGFQLPAFAFRDFPGLSIYLLNRCQYDQEWIERSYVSFVLSVEWNLETEAISSFVFSLVSERDVEIVSMFKFIIMVFTFCMFISISPHAVRLFTIAVILRTAVRKQCFVESVKSCHVNIFYKAVKLTVETVLKYTL